MIYFPIIDNILINNKKIRFKLAKKVIWFLFRNNNKTTLIRKTIIEKIQFQSKFYLQIFLL